MCPKILTCNKVMIVQYRPDLVDLDCCNVRLKKYNSTWRIKESLQLLRPSRIEILFLLLISMFYLMPTLIF